MRFQDGFALAALLLEDDGSTGVLRALGATLRAQLAERHAALLRVDRRVEARRLATAVRPEVRPDAPLSPRMRSLLATVVDREVGARWLTAAPPPRRGFVPSAGLRHALARLGAALRPDDAACAARERGVGRETLARALRGMDSESAERLLEACGPEEAAAVMALGPLLDASHATPTEARLVHASRRATGAERVRALGALVLGARGDLGGDAASQAWRRAGAEVRAVTEED